MCDVCTYKIDYACCVLFAPTKRIDFTLSRVSLLLLQQHPGNVHTGATPPWLRQDDDDSDVEEVCVFVLIGFY